MEKPDLERMWETRIKIGLPTLRNVQDAIRQKIAPTFPRLLEEGNIKWYHFLIHPCPPSVDPDPGNACLHIRFSPGPVGLPRYCVATEKTGPLRGISKVNASLLETEEIEEAWRILGEQSQWVVNLINIHKKDISIPLEQIAQFMHFYSNMLGLGNQIYIKIDNQWVCF